MEEIVYHTNYELENTYWWFLARNEIVLNAIRNIAKINNGEQILDIGCGTGGFAEFLSNENQVICLDTSELAIEYCQKRGLKNLYLCYLNEFPKQDWNIKSAVMLDVIEHIEDDSGVVKQVFDLLPKGGSLVATVPAYQALWSHHDVVHKHFRRYNKKQIKSLFEKTGFEVVYVSYSNFFLFPLAYLKRIYDKLFHKVDNEYIPVERVSKLTNSIFKWIFKSEKNFQPAISFPYGLSVLIVGRKN